MAIKTTKIAVKDTIIRSAFKIFKHSNYFQIKSINILLISISLLFSFASFSKIGYKYDLLSLFSGFILSYILLSISIIDINYMLIPIRECLIGIIYGFTINLINIILNGDYFFLIINYISASLIGFLSFILIKIIGDTLLKKSSLGMGDCYLIALIGAWLGINGLLQSIFMAFILSGIFFTIGLLSNRLTLKNPIPFAPFLSFAALFSWAIGTYNLALENNFNWLFILN